MIFRRDPFGKITFVALLIVVAIGHILALSHVHQHLVPINVSHLMNFGMFCITDFNADKLRILISLPVLGNFFLPWRLCAHNLPCSTCK